MNSNVFSEIIVVGLRSNSKLCYSLDGYIWCGLGCKHNVPLYNKTMAQAIDLVIEKHDQWMLAEERDRKRTDNPRFSGVESIVIRRPVIRARWPSRVPDSLFSGSAPEGFV